jgi:hypothetical protein
MKEPTHVSSDDGRTIQMSIHEIAQSWMRRGFCMDCVVRQIIIGASVVAQDARRWPAREVHAVVDDAFDTTSTKHIRHDH